MSLDLIGLIIALEQPRGSIVDLSLPLRIAAEAHGLGGAGRAEDQVQGSHILDDSGIGIDENHRLQPHAPEPGEQGGPQAELEAAP